MRCGYWRGVQKLDRGAVEADLGEVEGGRAQIE
jgi:hypothetical protein